jgi:hypothetical protein
MLFPVMNNLIHDVEKRIALFQPTFHSAEMVFRRLSGRRDEHSQRLSSLGYEDGFAAIGYPPEEVREMLFGLCYRITLKGHNNPLK